eukprot:1196213-Prorocentrum_minimum.AAC.1
MPVGGTQTRAGTPSEARRANKKGARHAPEPRREEVSRGTGGTPRTAREEARRRDQGDRGDFPSRRAPRRPFGRPLRLSVRQQPQVVRFARVYNPSEGTAPARRTEALSVTNRSARRRATSSLPLDSERWTDPTPSDARNGFGVAERDAVAERTLEAHIGRGRPVLPAARRSRTRVCSAVSSASVSVQEKNPAAAAAEEEERERARRRRENEARLLRERHEEESREKERERERERQRQTAMMEIEREAARARAVSPLGHSRSLSVTLGHSRSLSCYMMEIEREAARARA